MKVRGALASTSGVDLLVKVRSLFVEYNPGGAVDLRVRFFSPLAGHKQGDTGTAATSGNGTSRSSSRGRDEGRSCRGGVEEAAEMRLSNLSGFFVFLYLMGLEV